MRRGRTIAAATAAALIVVAVATGAASSAVSLGVNALDDLRDTGSRVGAPPATTPEPRDRDVAPTPTVVAAPEPKPVLERGDRGRKVRELQHRLYQLAWFPPTTTGRFDGATRKAVRGFQRKRGFEVTGEVDRRTWRRLKTMSRMPSPDEMFNRSGPALFAPGDEGPAVREIQARLRQIGWFFGDVSDSYGPATTESVRGFQAKRQIPVTGEVDRRTLDLLEGMTSEPTRAELDNVPPDPADGAALDARCLTGRALCVDKSSNSLRWVVDGVVLVTLDVRFGLEGMETREGQFAVSYKSRDHVSSLYGSSMPFALFFSGGQAVHYSPDFAATGYNGGSHGCVNVRDYGAMAALFDQVQIGDKVVVYWS